MSGIARREVLIALTAMACSRAATRRDDAPPSPDPSTSERPRGERSCAAPRLLDWRVDSPVQHVVTLAPSEVQGRYPVVIALHGRGEALKGPDAGAFGWPSDYALAKAWERLCAPPLVADDFGGLVTDDYLGGVNREFRARPWRGLVVVCPYLPDLDLRRDHDVVEYGRFLVEVLLPRIHKELPTTARVGIDGVSLGGAVALRAGLRFPDTFAAVAALQPALDGSRLADLVDLARAARARHPTLALRLTTSHGDDYREVTRALSSGWSNAGIIHDFSELPGPHDYVFNRGPGVYELLTWHRRVLDV